MQEEPYRPRKVSTQPEINPLDRVESVQRSIREQSGDEDRPFNASDAPFEIKGNMPPQFQQALAQARQARQVSSEDHSGGPSQKAAKQSKIIKDPLKQKDFKGSANFDEVINKISRFTHQWETIELPSQGKFYNGQIGETLNIRPMTGEEEKILATSRFVKKGDALDMIFEKVIQNRINPRMLLTVDRVYLLIYLRAISYTPEYDVEIKCPECGIKFAEIIDLDKIETEFCPDDFGPDDLVGTLPTTGLDFKYRLPTGMDDMEISKRKERKTSELGNTGGDDTLLYRIGYLLESIEGLDTKAEIMQVLNRLPVSDVSYLRQQINDPPFGTQTKIPMICPSCSEEFDIELPMDASFFSPRKKEKKTD